jgi:hypothetical protein
VVLAFRSLGEIDFHALYTTIECITSRAVVWGDWRTVIHADVAGVIGGEDNGCRRRDCALANFLTIYEFSRLIMAGGRLSSNCQK